MKRKRYDNILWFILLITLWEILVQTSKAESFIPSFFSIVRMLYQEIMNGLLIKHSAVSLLMVLQGYFISVICALVAAVFAYKVKAVDSLLSFLYQILCPLPSVAILPIVLICNGLKQSSILILIFHAVFWPVYNSNVMGFKSIPSVLNTFADNTQIPFVFRIPFLYIPSAFPHILSGLRNAWGRAWRSLLSAEAIFGISGGTQGLGYYIYYHRSFANIENIFAAIIIIALISMIIDKIFALIKSSTVEKWGVVNEQK